MERARGGEPAETSSLYRAVWRWHFFAGLITLPVLALLACTGAAYLFAPELDHLLYKDIIDVPARSGAVAAAPPSVVMRSMEQSVDGRVLQLILPDRPDRSVKGVVRVGSGDVLTVYADPYDAHVMGSVPFGGVMQTVRKVHSLQLFGFWASSVVEVVAGWAIILVATGVILWWPRGRSGGVVTVRATPQRRVWWRDLHAVTGVFSGGVIVFLAVTGMPWSMFWGAKFQAWAGANGLSAPAPPAEVTPAFLLSVPRPDLAKSEHGHHEAPRMVPWALERAPAPASVATAAGAVDIGIDSAVAVLSALRMPRPFGLQPPESERGAYVATYQPGPVDSTRVVYLDQFDGHVLADVGYAQYGPVGKAVEWGVAVHQGFEYGEINRYLMLAGCTAILLLVISAPVMWWKRRPEGTFGVPPAARSRRVAWAVTGVIAAVGIVFPLVGVSILIALLIDLLVPRLGVRRLA